MMTADLLLQSFRIFFVVLSCGYGHEHSETNNGGLLPIGTPQRCATILGRNVTTFEVLPGYGWDNLANEELGQIIHFKYEQCRLTEDGMYLIPDDVNVVPVKTSNVGLYSEVIDSMTDYKSVTSSSINTHFSAGLKFGLYNIAGTFSSDHHKAKRHMCKKDQNTVLSRVTSRYDRYKVIIQPDAQLTSTFKKRVLEIGRNFQLNDRMTGRYLSELLVRDFGTHIVTTVDAGALLVKEDVLKKKNSKITDDEEKKLQIGAGLSFSAVFPSHNANFTLNFGIEHGSAEAKSMIANYSKIVKHSKITAHGGKVLDHSNVEKDSWIESLTNNLVAVDRLGHAIHELMTPSNFPELPVSIVLDVHSYVQAAFQNYYQHNTYRGCTDPMAKNFDFTANLESGACESTASENIIGGAYQTCEVIESDAGNLCAYHVQRNPLTGDFSCPDGYLAAPLVSGNLSRGVIERRCRGVWFWKKCINVIRMSSSVFRSYWCAANNIQRQTQRMYFGGIYTSKRPNELTGQQSCPSGDSQVVTVGDDINICLESSHVSSYGFGGMFSCQNGNKMAAKTGNNSSNDYMKERKFPKTCPPKFSQKFVTHVDGCEVEFCSNILETTKATTLPVLQRPPFIKHPYPEKDAQSNADMVLLGSNGKWFKNEKAYDKMTDILDLETKMKSYKKSSDSLNKLSVAWSMLTPVSTSAEDESSTFDSADSNFPFGDDQLSASIMAVIATLATVCCILATSLFVVVRRHRADCQARAAHHVINPNATESRIPDLENDTETSVLIQPQHNDYGSSNCT